MSDRTKLLSLAAAAAVASFTSAGCRYFHKSTPAVSTTTLTSGDARFVEQPAMPGYPDVASLVASVSPSVVNITSTQEVSVPKGTMDPFEFFFGHEPRGSRRGREGVVKRRGLGSGFIIDDTGHVATNAHVVADADMVRVMLSDGREFDAKVKGRDERLDLAILELAGAKDLPHAVLGHSELIRVGDYVVAIGNPFGLGNTVTMGIVSAKGRELGAGPYDDFIQTDASINPGNSGGPIFNLRGEVVGISTAIIPAGKGIGFAIPIDALREVLPQLLTKGFVSRGKLGVMIEPMDPGLAKALGLGQPRGALLAEVEPGSAGQRAGLRSGDVIVGIDQTDVVHGHDLPRLIARISPGTRVDLRVVRDGAPVRTLQATLDATTTEKAPQAKPSPPAAGGPGGFGVELGDDGQGGVFVRSVSPGSPAEDSLEPGDNVLEVDGTAVSTAKDAAKRVKQTAARPPLLKIKRAGHTLYVALERQ